MPALTLDDDVVDQLERTESGTIGNTEGPGVALHWNSDRSICVVVYVGLKLDGLRAYQNISSVHPNIKMQFALPPDVFCKSDDLDFDPRKDEVISIQVTSASLIRFRFKFSCIVHIVQDGKLRINEKSTCFDTKYTKRFKNHCCILQHINKKLCDS